MIDFGITENLLYIFSSGTVLMVLLAVLCFVGFYFAFYAYFLIVFAKPKKASATFVNARLRDIKIVKVLASSAPMIGLLGTVIGIGQCISSADDVVTVSDGISYALLTTQTGLMTAIAIWIFAIIITSKLKKLSLDYNDE
ncbi:MAG: MotA/TolQ/ExbB proton channel family protein [Opitutales bacterium]|nr:MotA/TolQ/ExbB proton channel family protein [Opitutales bacterium]